MATDSWEDLTITLAQMSRDLLAQDTAQQTLDRIVEHAVDRIDGCEHAGILLLRHEHQVETAAATSELVHESDRIQGELGEGPCFDAVEHDKQVYRLADINQKVLRWPRYAPQARQLGIASMMGFQLITAEDEFGALDVYSSQPNTFTEHAERVGWLLASHAAVAFSSARLRARLQAATDSEQVAHRSSR